ncbi:MAG TPA: RNA polymerase sigma factor [Verrucomicrobiae bacterium]|nr:RNA polymerase sigma factor [Verrucomicrobiae bacterium]
MELTSTTLNPILLAKAGEERSSASPLAELARRAAEGSIDAFEELAIQFEPRIYGFLCRHIGNAHDAQDLTQETFVRAWRGIARFDPNRDFATWIFVIARRAAANHFRSRRVHEELTEDFVVETSESTADAEGLWRAAKKLKPNHYEALWLRYAEGFSVAQTAKVMGLTTIHTKVILHRARKELARRIKRETL